MLTYKKVFDTKTATHEEWLMERRKGIGGSDMAAILGYSKWKSAIDVWLDKTSTGEPEDEENRFMYWGNKLEQLVADEFEIRTGKKVRRNNYVLESIEYPYLRANLDREIVGSDEGLECKTTSAYNLSDWEEDEVPDAYYIQCQHYMAVTGAPAWWIACLIGGNEFIYKRIPRNEDVIQFIIDQGAVFWKLVKEGKMPEVDGSESSARALKGLYPNSNSETKVLEGYAVSFIEKYKEASEAEKKAKEEKANAQNHLCAMLEEFEVGTCGMWTVNWKSTKPRETFDTKSFKKDHPELAKAYIKAGASSRRFSIK